MNVLHKILPVIVSLAALYSCTNDMEMVNKIIDPEEDPDLTATNIEVLYSDSARLQMKLIAPLVKQYESVKEPREEFPEGIHVWFYEKTGELKAEITANWAKNNQLTKIWEARDNVVLINSDGAKLETEQMFWDQQKAIVYSEKFTKYTSKTGTVATGKNGMRAKQDFSQWRLLSGNATLVFEDEPAKEEQEKE